MSRRLEMLSGTMGAAAGLAGLIVGLFFDTRTTVQISAWGVATAAGSVWAHGMDGQLALYVVVMLMAIAAIGIGAYLHSETQHLHALMLLWMGTTVMAAGILLDLPAWSSSVSASGVSTWNDTGIGVFLIPAMLLGAIAALAGLLNHPQSGRRLSARPM